MPEKDLGWRTAIAVVSGMAMVGGLQLATSDDTDHSGWEIVSADAVELNEVEPISRSVNEERPAYTTEGARASMTIIDTHQRAVDHILAMMLNAR